MRSKYFRNELLLAVSLAFCAVPLRASASVYCAVNKQAKVIVEGTPFIAPRPDDPTARWVSYVELAEVAPGYVQLTISVAGGGPPDYTTLLLGQSNVVRMAGLIADPSITNGNKCSTPQ